MITWEVSKKIVWGIFIPVEWHEFQWWISWTDAKLQNRIGAKYAARWLCRHGMLNKAICIDHIERLLQNLKIRKLYRPSIYDQWSS